MDMSRVAACWVEVVEATSALEEARRRLSVGGRGHSRAEVRRLEARRLKADRGYGEARAQLEQVGARARHEAMLARYGARPRSPTIGGMLLDFAPLCIGVFIWKLNPGSTG